MVQDIRYVLHQHGKWLAGFDVVQPLQKQSRTWVMEEGLRMGIDLAQLRTTNASESLARRSAYNDIKRIQNGSEPEISGEHLW